MVALLRVVHGEVVSTGAYAEFSGPDAAGSRWSRVPANGKLIKLFVRRRQITQGQRLGKPARVREREFEEEHERSTTE